MVLTDILRQAAFFVDSAVYKLIPILYKLIIYLANVNFFGSSGTLSLLINRIYALVGIFMLFKLSFSVVRYIVDPDSFSDSSKGFANFIRRVLVAFVLLAIVPQVFGKLYEIQEVVITNNVIPNLILGNDENKTEDLEDAAKDLQFLLFGSFFSINYNAPSYGSCTPTDDYPLANVIGSRDMVLVDGGACFDAFTEGIKDPQVSASGVVLEDFFKTASNDDASSTSDIKDIRRFEAFEPLVNWKDVNDYSINYIPVSVVCGIYLVFLLLSFCIDIAGRAIRLLFMQVLSPVAIISSVDPTSSSQEDKLKEWIKECFKVFVSLFIRLAVIYCVIQLVKIISESVIPHNTSLYYDSNLTNSKNGKSMNLYIYVFLILGAFQVAKKIPELIEKALGIKFSGELRLNPFKALSEDLNNPFVGAVAGTVGGAASGAISAYSTARNHNHGLVRSLGSGIGALVTGGATGLARGGMAGGAKGWSAGLQSGGRIARRMEVREATGGPGGIRGMIADRARDVVGAPTTYESMENKAKRYDDVGQAIQAMKDRATDQLSKKSDDWKAIQASRELYAQWLKDGVDNNGNRFDQDAYVARLNDAYKQEQKLIADYINGNSSINNGKSDGQLEMLRNSLVKTVKDSKLKEYDKNGKATGNNISIDASTNWNDIGADGAIIKTSAETSALRIRSSREYNDARDRDQAIHSSRLDAHQKH